MDQPRFAPALFLVGCALSGLAPPTPATSPACAVLGWRRTECWSPNRVSDGKRRRTDLEQENSAPMPRASRMGGVLGSLAALLIIASAILLIIAGAIHYFAEHRTGTEVTLESGSPRAPEALTVASNPRTPDNSEKPVSPTTSPQQSMLTETQSPLTSEAQRSGSAPPPPRAANTAAALPAATATAPATPTSPATEKTAMSPRPSASEQRTNAATTPQSTEPAGTQKTTMQPSVRDQAAALPDRPAATSKKENVFIVMRGPAKIRSDPGKKGRVIGTAPKNATVRELDRAGNWVQIETEVGTGWIHAALLGLADPVASRAER